MNPFEPNELVRVIAGEVPRPTAHEPVPTEICLCHRGADGQPARTPRSRLIWGASAAVLVEVARRMRDLLAESDTEISAGVRSSASHGVAEVKRPGALHHEGVLEHDVAADEFAEVADAGAEQHRHLADAELVDEAEVERLLDNVGAGDRDELVAGELLCRRDRLFDAAREGRPREPLCRVLGR